MINVSNNTVRMGLPVLFHKKLVNPHDDVILEYPFDNLME
jgi:hypothetical protein